MHVLKSLTFVANTVGSDPVATRRANFISQLHHQRALAEDPAHVREVWVTRTAGDGSKERVSLKKPVRRWWSVDVGGRVLLKLRYGRKPLELEKGKPRIHMTILQKAIRSDYVEYPDYLG